MLSDKIHRTIHALCIFCLSMFCFFFLNIRIIHSMIRNFPSKFSTHIFIFSFLKHDESRWKRNWNWRHDIEESTSVLYFAIFCINLFPASCLHFCLSDTQSWFSSVCCLVCSFPFIHVSLSFLGNWQIRSLRLSGLLPIGQKIVVTEMLDKVVHYFKILFRNDLLHNLCACIQQFLLIVIYRRFDCIVQRFLLHAEF